MKSLIFAILLIPSLCFSADVDLSWLVEAEATGYKIYMSQDLGQTWDSGLDVGLAQQDPIIPAQRTYTYTGVPEDKIILFKCSAYNDDGEGIREWSGAWYDFRKKEN